MLVVDDVVLNAHLLFVDALQELLLENDTHSVLAVDDLVDFFKGCVDSQAEVRGFVNLDQDVEQ